MSEVIYLFGDSAPLPSVVSIGSFDGVHRGHKAILDRIRSVSKSNNLRSLVATFDPHPREFLGYGKLQNLTTISERKAILKEYEVDAFAVIPFSTALSLLEPDVFVRTVLVEKMGAKAIVTGHDHRFGRDRKGDSALLRELGEQLGFSVLQCDPETIDGEVVSSSLIRELVETGRVKKAHRFMGRRHSFTGKVVRGAGRGKSIGISTANLQTVSEDKLSPGVGVYAVLVEIPDEATMKLGMMNIGYQPTFDGTELHLEVNILDWSGDLYDREVRVEFVERIRNEKKFDSIEGLIEQLNKDRVRCRRLLGEIS